MAMETAMQNAYYKRMEKMREDGFFLPAQRSMAGNTRYLIVSNGGTGAEALFGVKKKLETVLDARELRERIRFLAIDTDKDTQHCTRQVRDPDGTSRTVEVDALTADEFCQLSGTAARMILNTDRNIDQWLNPKMRQTVAANPNMLTGTGASGIRQLGRLTLYPATTKATLASKLNAQIGALTNGNADPLKIFVLTGIAGGTGSGTVVDITYLIRSLITAAPGGLDQRTSVAGFVLLPPTGNRSGDPVAVEHGNRNGYAALKEINHFMTLPERGETYELIYGDGSRVKSREKIFDICYLLDGGTDQVSFADPRQKAIHVLAESMLDMITASQTVGTNKIQAVDSFMNDCHTMTTSMVSGKPVAHAPRDADYIYCALGHCEITIPTNEIKAYVGRQFFDKIYKMLQKCGNVEPEDVKTFVKNVISEGVSTGSAAKKAVEKQVNFKFNDWLSHKGGPYYVINLLYDVPRELQRLRGQARMFRPGHVSDEALSWIEQHCLTFNNSIFNVYTKALDAMKSLMESQYDMVVSAGLEGNTYSFLPRSLGRVQGDQVVIDYLDSLISKKNLGDLVNSLLREMLDNREKWTDLYNAGPSEAPTVMRAFWNDQLDRIIGSTLEDFLIKYYSQDPEACFSKENYGETLPYLQKAAQTIYKEMLSAQDGGAQPLLSLTGTGLTPMDFNAHTYLLVPSCAPNLLQELQNVARSAPEGSQVDVCESLSRDRISCYKQYTSVPAFKLQWVCNAEKDYEKGLRSEAGVGLHMSETPGGNLWRNFSNLLPCSSWPILPMVPQYENPRERQLADQAQSLFARANALGLISGVRSAAGTDNLQYTARILPEEDRPEDRLFQDLDRSLEGSTEQRELLSAIDQAVDLCASRLLARKTQAGDRWETAEDLVLQLKDLGLVFGQRPLWFTNSILTVGPADVRPEGWDEYVAGTMLRKMPSVMNELNGSVLVLDRVREKVDTLLKSRQLVTLLTQYLCCGLLTFRPDLSRWVYEGSGGVPVPMVQVVGPVAEACQYYGLFDYLREHRDRMYEDLKARYGEEAPLGGAPDSVDRMKRYMERAKALGTLLAPWNGPKTPVSPYGEALRAGGVDVDKVENFHRCLLKELQFAALGVFVPVVDTEPRAKSPALPEMPRQLETINTGEF